MGHEWVKRGFARLKSNMSDEGYELVLKPRVTLKELKDALNGIDDAFLKNTTITHKLSCDDGDEVLGVVMRPYGDGLYYEDEWIDEWSKNDSCAEKVLLKFVDAVIHDAKILEFAKEDGEFANKVAEEDIEGFE